MIPGAIPMCMFFQGTTAISISTHTVPTDPKAVMVRTKILRTGSDRGFTLIELSVVLLIIGIAASIVIVSISNQYKKSIIKYEARKLYTSLNHSRELSITRHKLLTFDIYEDNTGYSITENEKTIVDKILPDGILIYADKIVFYPLGDSSGGIISIIDDDGRKYEITVSAISGKAKVQRVQSS